MSDDPSHYTRRKSAVDRRAREAVELFPIKEDLAEWLSKIMGIDITAHNFLDVLENGVFLCKLVQRVQDICQRRIEEGLQEPEVRIPLTRTKCHSAAEKRSFYARDNVSKFIDFARALGVQEAVLFESNGLVNQEQPKEVILTLLEFARLAARYGIEPPDLVTLENEIDKEEAATAEESVVVEAEASVVPEGPPEDEVDRLVRDIIKRVGYKFPIRRLGEGRYVVEPGKTKLFVRVLRAHIMVRVGGGWTTLEYFLVKHKPSQVKLTNYGSTERLQKTRSAAIDEPDTKESENCETNPKSTPEPVKKPLVNRLSRELKVAMPHPKSKPSANPSTPAFNKPPQQKGSVKRPTMKQEVTSKTAAHIPNKKQSAPARGGSKTPKPLQPLALHSRLANSPYLQTPVRKVSAPTRFPPVSKSQTRQKAKSMSE